MNNIAEKLDTAGYMCYALGIILFICHFVFGVDSLPPYIVFFNFVGAGSFLISSKIEKNTYMIWFNSFIFGIQLICMLALMFAK